MAAQCKKCKSSDVTWAKSMARAGGWILLDIYPDASRGTVRKRIETERGKKVVYGQVLAGTELYAALADNAKLYVRHSETCTARRPFNPRPQHLDLDLPLPRRSRFR